MKSLFFLAALLLPAAARAGEYGPAEEYEAPAAEPAPAEPGDLRWESFTATAYQPWCNGCSGRTADGTRAVPAWNIIAVDPNVIPLGKKVVVRRKDGSCRVFTARDTGGAVKGRKIDVLVASHREAINFGVQKVELARLEGDASPEFLAAQGCAGSRPAV